jgi:hypothetical protein
LGVRLEGAVASLRKQGESEFRHRAMCSPVGEFLFLHVEPGCYIVTISTTRGIEFSTNVRIVANEDKNLGTIQEPGMYSVTENGVIYSVTKPGEFHLPCLSKFDQLRKLPSDLMLDSADLEALTRIIREN